MLFFLRILTNILSKQTWKMSKINDKKPLNDH